MNALCLQVHGRGGWRIFRPVFSGRAAALREFAIAAAALPNERVRLIDAGTREVLATSSPDAGDAAATQQPGVA